MRYATPLRPTTMRLPDETLRQLKALQEAYGQNRTQTLIRIIERVYTQTTRVQTKESETK